MSRTAGEPSHRATEAAVKKWWDERANRPTHTATWNPTAGVEAFRKAFDPNGELGNTGGVFLPHADGNLMVTWQGQTYVVLPGGSWTYRPRRTRQLTPTEVVDTLPPGVTQS